MDDLILRQILNPNDPAGHITSTEALDTDEEALVVNEANLPEIAEAKQLEVEAVRLAESGDLDGSIATLNNAIDACPHYASAYNNRAQVLRLKGNENGALLDLDKAIELSGGKGLAARQAYTQRGLIHVLKESNDEALENFRKAAHLGSQFARQQVIRMNPYAAMCNRMLGEAIEKLRRGEED